MQVEGSFFNDSSCNVFKGSLFGKCKFQSLWLLVQSENLVILCIWVMEYYFHFLLIFLRS